MTNDEKLTITLTGRPPVRINKADWPILAEARDELFDGVYDFQANTTAKWRLAVRVHADGRAIVYTVYTYSSNYQGAKSYWLRGGELLEPGADLPEAIGRVAREIEERMPELGEYGPGVYPRLMHECIADLPAVEI